MAAPMVDENVGSDNIRFIPESAPRVVISKPALPLAGQAGLSDVEPKSTEVKPNERAGVPEGSVGASAPNVSRKRKPKLSSLDTEYWKVSSAKRVRTKADKLTFEAPARKERNDPEGTGVALGEIPAVAKQLLSMAILGESLARKLHSVLYNRPGKRKEQLRGIRKFCGWTFVGPEQQEAKKNKLAKLFTEDLRALVKVFGLTVEGAHKDGMVDTVMNFLVKPDPSKVKPPQKKQKKVKKPKKKKKKVAKKSTSKKKKKTTIKKKKNVSKKKKKKKTAVVPKVTGYQAFTAEVRASVEEGMSEELRKKNLEVMKLVRERWSKLSDEEKLKYKGGSTDNTATEMEPTEMDEEEEQEMDEEEEQEADEEQEQDIAEEQEQEEDPEAMSTLEQDRQQAIMGEAPEPVEPSEEQEQPMVVGSVVMSVE
eukprot:516611_1